MVIEFMGIGIFSFLMNSINKLFDTEIELLEIIDKRMENIETWLSEL